MSRIAGLLHAVSWRLGATRRLWRHGTRADLRFPTAAFDATPRGELDEPAAGARVEAEMLQIRGWALFPSAPNARVDVWLGEHSLGTARVGVARPDLQNLSRNPFAAGAGFELAADLSGLEPAGELPLRVVATGTDGKRHELPPTPLTVSPPGGRAAADAGLPAPAPTTPRSTAGEGRRAVVFTHQLNLGGAQLYLLDLLRELIAQGSVSPTVVSAMDGPLRRELEDLGVPTHISSLHPIEDLSSHIGRVEELAAWASGRDFELAFLNTATVFTFPGAEAAELLGIPAVWAIHESFPPAVIWAALTPELRERAERALGNAALAIFEAESTRRIFESRIGEGRTVMLPYGLDLAPIDAARARIDAAAARRDAGIAEDAEVVICVGTVEPRKAQLTLAQAFGMIADRHPRARLVFVGGRDDADSRALADFIEASGAGDRIELVPVTPEIEPWYALADLLVCASDVESLPRTVLEAMAWGAPVLATSVFGLPELIEDGVSGWLCEPRDTSALADALDRALQSPAAEREKIGETARHLVETRHALDRYGRDVGRLLDQVADGKTPDTAAHATAH